MRRRVRHSQTSPRPNAALKELQDKLLEEIRRNLGGDGYVHIECRRLAEVLLDAYNAIESCLWTTCVDFPESRLEPNVWIFNDAMREARYKELYKHLYGHLDAANNDPLANNLVVPK